MAERQARLGLFASYSEKKNGKFEDAVEFCHHHEYVIWLEKSAINARRFLFPTTILIKITAEDRYYRGELRDIKRAEEVDRASLLAEQAHRPPVWRQVDKVDYVDFRSVLYIAGLSQVPRPAGVARDSAPQRPWGLAEAILRGSPADELGRARAQQEERAFNPLSLEDARTRMLAAIVVRQGRSSFRAELLAAYQRTCAVTGCDVEAALEAAHIVPYRGPETDDVRNGLLLRADIHTLFDLHLITLNPADYRLLVSKRIKGQCYDALAGQLIRLPADQSDYPSREALEIRLAEFHAEEDS